MGYFKLGKMTLKSLFKRPETIRYPYETKPPVEDLKGHVENDIVECTLCGICAKRCPTGCITVDKEAESWTINPFDCIQCRTCVRECPQHCLTMMPEYRKPAFEKVVSVTTKKKKQSLHVRKRKKLLELRRRWKRKLHVKKLSRNKLAKRLKLRLPI